MNNLIIYAEEGTQISNDPGILHFNPNKLILVGAQLVEEKKLFGDLGAQLGPEWERIPPGQLKDSISVNDSFATQRIVPSVKEALDDVLPKRPDSSSEVVHRIYVVK